MGKFKCPKCGSQEFHLLGTVPVYDIYDSGKNIMRSGETISEHAEYDTVKCAECSEEIPRELAKKILEAINEAEWE